MLGSSELVTPDHFRSKLFAPQGHLHRVEAPQAIFLRDIAKSINAGFSPTPFNDLARFGARLGRFRR